MITISAWLKALFLARVCHSQTTVGKTVPSSASFSAFTGEIFGRKFMKSYPKEKVKVYV